MSDSIQKTSFSDWNNCFSLKSDGVEMIATADVGPRIIFFGLEGKTNLLKLFEDEVGRSGDNAFLFYGGHRLWAAPEDPLLSYIPDNRAVEVRLDENEWILTLIRKADESNLEKRLSMRVATMAERKMFVEDSQEVHASENLQKDNINQANLMRVAILNEGDVVTEDSREDVSIQLSHEHNVETARLIPVSTIGEGDVVTEDSVKGEKLQLSHQNNVEPDRLIRLCRTGVVVTKDSGGGENIRLSDENNVETARLMRVATLDEGDVVTGESSQGESIQPPHDNDDESAILMRVATMDQGKDVEMEDGRDDDPKSFARPGLEEPLSEPPSMNDESSKHHFQNNKDCDSGVMASFVVRNELINRGQSPIRTASWGISSLAPGGMGFMPIEKKINPEKRFQASNQINLWPYTSLANPAYQWKDEWLEIDQTRTKSKQKIGSFNRKAWLAYRLEDQLIVIFLPGLQIEEELYPDLRSNIEIYFDEDMLELETLSPWKTIDPGESVYHDEVWTLIKINDDPDNETVIREYVYPLVDGQIK